MVSFAVSPTMDILEKEIDKPVFRMTPYPLPSVAEGEDDYVEAMDDSNMFEGSGDDEGQEENLQQLVSEVDSPDAVTANGNNALSLQEQENEGWEQWIQGVQDDSASPNLPTYLLAKADRMTAKKAFENALERVMESMHRAMGEEMLADTIGVVYQDQGDHFDRLEANIMDVVQSNHDRRQHMVLTVDQAHERWERRYKRLRGDILKEEKTNDIPITTTNKRTGTGAMTSGAAGGEERSNIEPDWEAIAAKYEPAGRNAQSFLDHRDALRHAEHLFVDALDEVTKDLQTGSEAISQILADFYDRNEDEFATTEREIQYHLMINHQRRLDLELRLMEATKQSQGFFANLLSRLSGSE